MPNKRARSNEVHMDIFMEGRQPTTKKRRLPVNSGPAKRHISQCLDPRLELHPPHYPDPFRPRTRPVDITRYCNPYPAVQPVFTFPSFRPVPSFSAPVPELEPMDWQTSAYSEPMMVAWSFPLPEETPMDWE
ncbi:Hypp2737 [Branchiostoma lanceolatum]|uniref:Hypp2737 protein n=1 Tax=Branchiostoma lanceolatum TaxID=7740 RepID=A0A8J9ZX57_BRALA|nr:Hypp2737 [Branchiostoma lanceolatum]